MRSLISLLLLFLFVSPVLAEEYDGIWFLGFNTKKSACNRQEIRLKIAQALTKEAPSIIPPGNEGVCDPFSLQDFDASAIRFPRTITLLHTDGVKTKEIAKELEKKLVKVGVKVSVRVVDYAKGRSWEETLAKEQFDLFLMGYKAKSSKDLLLGLFSPKGEANFMRYDNKAVAKLIKGDKLKEANLAIQQEMPALVVFYITKL